ncbi:UNKNOWN [Stylonychia lemnae]|uniref:Uncharacterized protein n=1 Tax=Stylonychia lemnae TaxID=5949 RepID=A0A077ZY24_STYLE|nr:UNKNOWN [Stylonychia lemnae]|eukprot:CDW73431.1 UNKNOWN [Stylonychia lemnae]
MLESPQLQTNSDNQNQYQKTLIAQSKKEISIDKNQLSVQKLKDISRMKKYSQDILIKSNSVENKSRSQKESPRQMSSSQYKKYLDLNHINHKYANVQTEIADSQAQTFSVEGQSVESYQANKKSKKESISGRLNTEQVEFPRNDLLCSNDYFKIGSSEICMMMEAKGKLDSCKQMLRRLPESRNFNQFQIKVDEILSYEKKAMLFPINASTFVQELQNLQNYIKDTFARKFYQAQSSNSQQRLASSSKDTSAKADPRKSSPVNFLLQVQTKPQQESSQITRVLRMRTESSIESNNSVNRRTKSDGFFNYTHRLEGLSKKLQHLPDVYGQNFCRKSSSSQKKKNFIQENKKLISDMSRQKSQEKELEKRLKDELEECKIIAQTEAPNTERSHKDTQSRNFSNRQKSCYKHKLEEQLRQRIKQANNMRSTFLTKATLSNLPEQSPSPIQKPGQMSFIVTDEQAKDLLELLKTQPYNSPFGQFGSTKEIYQQIQSQLVLKDKIENENPTTILEEEDTLNLLSSPDDKNLIQSLTSLNSMNSLKQRADQMAISDFRLKETMPNLPEFNRGNQPVLTQQRQNDRLRFKKSPRDNFQHQENKDPNLKPIMNSVRSVPKLQKLARIRN